MSMKKSHDTIGNRTRDLPACSAVPQPTAPPCTPHIPGTVVNSYGKELIVLRCSAARCNFSEMRNQDICNVYFCLVHFRPEIVAFTAFCIIQGSDCICAVNLNDTAVVQK